MGDERCCEIPANDHSCSDVAAARREGVIEGLERALGILGDAYISDPNAKVAIKVQIERLRAEQKEQP